MVSIRKAPVLAYRGIFKLMVAKSVGLVYNMLNKGADTIADTYPFPA